MNNKNIAIPGSITQFYVECDNEDKPEDRFSDNKEEFDSIFNEIKRTPKMFKEIIKSDKDECQLKGKFEKVITKRTLIYIDNDGNRITGDTFVLKEKELSNLPYLRTKTRERSGTIKSECRKKKVHMYYYETKVYRGDDGKEIEGNECYVGDKWKEK